MLGFSSFSGTYSHFEIQKISCQEPGVPCRLGNTSVTPNNGNIMTASGTQEASVTKVKLALPAEVLGLLQMRLPPARYAHLH